MVQRAILQIFSILYEGSRLCNYVVHYDLVEAISQQNDNFFSAKERVLSNLRKHEDPQPPLVLHLMRPPVPVISSAMLLSQKDATELVRTDLNLLQQQAR